ncbi:type II CRISPR RNA-guided endonuclease Cas9 [Methylobacter sp. YRD-M1]|uniref:type II CRISPR RNA-guided endonuclease Cas9 n=1 Tax=Methylobacter sp. YRD-M1 TaxID=2911520 RepID=UPI00227B8D2C|nr:type II CRISPR RNA-guided endonuclease Cas9 [Methylobacter sp. YRD-M1]WAK03619.1 type II CRISPR RNA-guided endonuclease Cas9 [Methylobacter sp. YRD-M1]
MSKRVLGLSLSADAIGWALLEEMHGRPDGIVALGCRVLGKAVKKKTPDSKNAELTRRILQRRARRKQRMLNYLLKLNLLPQELKTSPNPEIILNRIGNPYHLRAKALDQKLSAYELGRVILHFVQRGSIPHGHKALPGDMIDDPDVLAVLAGSGKGDARTERGNEETDFKKDVAALKGAIKEAGCRTLGEYLSRLDLCDHKHNRALGACLRTDRQMHEDELELIWQQQQCHHALLTEQVKEQVERIIFYQRLPESRADRCILEPKRKQAGMARLESQRFRYLQTINSLAYFKNGAEHGVFLSAGQKGKLISLFEAEADVAFSKVRAVLGFDESMKFNLECSHKTLKGNVTACRIRKVLSAWDELGAEKQQALVEDLLTIGKKPVLKRRLAGHWGFDSVTAASLCLLELEPGYCHLSVKAINRLLPFLYQGQSYSDARVSAGYGFEIQDTEVKDKLGLPPEIANPVMQKGLHELRRLVNALIAEYGKPDTIRLRMTRDLEANARRQAEFIRQQKAKARANEGAMLMFQDMKRRNPYLNPSCVPDKTVQLKYRLWRDQHQRCAYSGLRISSSALFGSEVEIDHILPYGESLDDSYMNKVLCYRKENRSKGHKTPIDAFGGHDGQWNNIVQNLNRWDRSLAPKKKRFFVTAAELRKADFIGKQLNDARYISRITHDYLKQLGTEVSVGKGMMTAWIRQRWGLNSQLGSAPFKGRSDRRNHAIDALVIACMDRPFYKRLVEAARDMEHKQSQLNLDDLPIEPAWQTLREDLQYALSNMLVAHAPLLKETMACRIHRRPLNDTFTQINKIIDPAVRQIVAQHLERYNSKPKAAFAEGVTVYHKDGKTPIRRVRILRPEIALPNPETTQTGAIGEQGRVFKGLDGCHHVKIFRHKNTGEYVGDFVDVMEVRSLGKQKQPVIETDQAEQFEFVMALYVNDTVSVEEAGRRIFYRVQKLDAGSNGCTLRLHSAASSDGKDEEIHFSINEASFNRWRLRKHKVNAIGKLIGC